MYALGNHDAGKYMSARDIMKLDMTNPVSLSEVGPEDV